MNKPHTQPALPWWRVPMVWFVIGGPVLVVLASIATLTLAISGADTPLRETAPAVQAGSHTPAQQARNHAVTPGR